MPTSLINIGRTGIAASRAGLELTAQNIANAGNVDYSRRTLGQTEIVTGPRIGVNSAESLGGVRSGDIQRAGSELLQLQARSSASDLARADAELRGLRDTETALESSQIYETLVEFETALTRLESDPLDPTLRTLTLETGRQLTDTLGLADRTLGTARELVQAETTFGTEQVNTLAADLARINIDLTASRAGTARHAALLDQRDAALRELAGEVGIDVEFADTGAARVSVRGAPGAVLVDGASASTLTAAFAADGTATLAVDGQPIAPTTGAMAGRQAALGAQADAQVQLDTIAAAIIASGNAMQAGGSDRTGAPGQPLFSGTDAGSITLALDDGSLLATAPAGSAPGSRDTAALSGLIAAIGGAGGPVSATDTLLSGLSSRISGLDTRREGLAIIAESARAQLLSEAGVDLDTEAASLVRLQQAFEANSRVIQVASELFDTILNLQ